MNDLDFYGDLSNDDLLGENDGSTDMMCSLCDEHESDCQCLGPDDGPGNW